MKDHPRVAGSQFTACYAAPVGYPAFLDSSSSGAADGFFARELSLFNGSDPRLDAEGICSGGFDPASATWTVCSSPVGPAGTSELDLGAGATLIVDWADCFRVTSLLVPHPTNGFTSSGASALIEYILGDEARRRLFEANQEWFEVPVSEDGREPARSLCRLALLEDLRDDGGARSTGPSLWAAEAATLRDDVDLPSIRLLASLEAMRGAAALARLDLSGLDGHVVARCLEIAERLIPLVPDRRLREPLERLVAAGGVFKAPTVPRIDRSDDGFGSGLAEFARLRFVGSDRSRTHIDLDPVVEKYGVAHATGAALDWSQSGVVVSVAIKSGSRVSDVRNLWVRAFASSDGTLMALEPLSPEAESHDGAGYATARLRLPNEFDGQEVTIDITPDPALAAEAGPRGMIIRAAELGRAATRAGRLGLDAQAVRLWTRCANAWLELEDYDRSGLALWYAAMHVHNSHSDREGLIDTARDRAMEWAKKYTETPRETPLPFLAELAFIHS